MTNRKHLEKSGPFAGLWVRVSSALMKAGYKNPDEVRADIESGALHPFRPIHDYGKYADRDVRKWLGLRSWEEQWGKVPFSVISNYPASCIQLVDSTDMKRHAEPVIAERGATPKSS